MQVENDPKTEIIKVQKMEVENHPKTKVIEITVD